MSTLSPRRFRALPILAWGYVAWSLVPVLIAVAYSFNDGRSRTMWQGFSFRWWFGDPNASVFRDESMRQAIINSLALATATMLIVTPLGIALAVGSHRMRGKLSSGVQSLTSIHSSRPRSWLVQRCSSLSPVCLVASPWAFQRSYWATSRSPFLPWSSLFEPGLSQLALASRKPLATWGQLGCKPFGLY